MPYSLFTIIALVIHLIVNFDLFVKRKNSEILVAIKSYKLFLISIAIFYVTDILWGVFDEHKLALPLYIDTFIYFVAMVSTIFFWTRYVVKYFEGGKRFSFVIQTIGFLFVVAEFVLLVINIFRPILFYVDMKTALYYSLGARDVMLYIQIGLYFALAVYSTVATFIRKEENKYRSVAIASFSIIMAVFILFQVFNPYLPFYSIALLVGCCALYSLVINSAKEEYRIALNKSQRQEQIKEQELGHAIQIVNTDPLTGVKSRYAYVEMEEQMDKIISKNEAEEFAVVVFDLNGLKVINDTLGHEAGDEYIVNAVHIIEDYFGKEELYRFGGDEFVCVLKGSVYKNRRNLMRSFNSFIEKSEENNTPTISAGMSAYKAGEDNTFRAVFMRADQGMYARKIYLKEHN